jgi:hypothetical protein
MSKMSFGSISAGACLLVSVALAPAADITTKKILIKDNPDPTKRQVLILSKDTAATYASADTPSVGGASVHVYGSTTTDDFCAILEPGANWQNLGTKWKYKNTTSKNGAQIKDGKLLVKIKQDAPVLDYTLADDGSQGNVNVQVQFGTGTRFCMRCPGNIKDDGTKFLGKDCAIATCDAESTTCNPPNPTTTSSTSTSSTTSTTCPPGPPVTPTEVMGSLPATAGRFNYNLTLGLPGALAACNSNFSGTHPCEYSELQIGAAACDLAGLTDTNGMTVTAFWAIDPMAPILQQCNDDQLGGSDLNWEYATADTPSRGQRVTLNNTTGILGPLVSSLQCNAPLNNAWVACCN